MEIQFQPTDGPIDSEDTTGFSRVEIQFRCLDDVRLRAGINTNRRWRLKLNLHVLKHVVSP